jgi:hypothetical protein
MAAYVIFIREATFDKSELDAYAAIAAASLEGLPRPLSTHCCH